jgi:hypothetical protein
MARPVFWLHPGVRSPLARQITSHAIFGVLRRRCVLLISNFGCNNVLLVQYFYFDKVIRFTYVFRYGLSHFCFLVKKKAPMKGLAYFNVNKKA